MKKRLALLAAKISPSLISHIALNLLSFTLIFTAPTNLFFKFGQNQAYVNGLQVDYLINKLYLADLIGLSLILSLLLWFVSNQKLKLSSTKNWLKLTRIKRALLKITQVSNLDTWLIISLVGLGLSQFFTPQPWVSFWLLVKLLSLACLGWLLIKFLQTNPHTKKIINLSLASTILFQATVALIQFIQQQSIWGYLFLGEPNLLQPFSISTGQFFNQEKILPYGTTAHPNLLAGSLVIYWWLFNVNLNKSHSNTNGNDPKYQQIISWLLLLPLITTIFLTQSFSALAALVFTLGLIVLKKIINQQKIWVNFQPNQTGNKQSQSQFRYFLLISSLTILLLTPILVQLLALNFDSVNSFTRRARLNLAAWQIFQNRIFCGTGLNQFTIFLEKFSQSRAVVRFVQPVHHVLLLWLAESGLLGLSLLILCMAKLGQQPNPIKTKLLTTLLVISPILSLDHYLLSLQPGRIITVLLIVLSLV